MAVQFDMFAHEAREMARPATRRARPALLPSGPAAEASLVEQLTRTGRYRILRKLEPRAVTTKPRPGFPLRGVILDTETTGLDHRRNEIIEIGAIAFTYNASGDIGDITGVFGGLRQPLAPIPLEITRLTGITDEMVEGQQIDVAALEAMMAPADLIIAHNAAFDRPFCETFHPVFERKAWACSNAEIDWSARGYEGTKLGYLIGQAGFFHEGHRAVDDCFALLEVLNRAVDGVPTAFAELHEASQASRVRIYAEHSPFDMKDHLKARGYRWADGSDGRPKSWWIEIAEEAVDEELRFLRSEIYRYPEADPPMRRLTAFDRFRT
ncbi:DNA polymerase-3 subunit epsilon [Rhizobium sp. PP-F2F-G38]|uniref:3'-5' exonuclease n=1 Tax=Ferranicluibacter rubi TaxID=2715133 RepID=A0AA44CA61_9HYPH|nr:3'-5' exonuclease [Ferranicluibacter rubi]PYE33939.1 DNA polymerase-3 subunit epsilon [Rhizobium sp. PP-WC-1G-195]PYE94462.1 DNA polymerase-3 subunit epsilon [Rhizobium sp. PP-F2F-G38]TCP80375.1 DNA polymerase-3 subunit epsilon [Rhizobium sp. PP-CC-2G-626]TCQ23737.1 DNA polymerase-3 subunit epsilon [Rhizobium sp. PP-CC-3G-465]NHT75513.1 3'-5' exonuclease [Ferranicluibacter rubi]